MPRPPTGKINVTRIDKNLLFKGEKGTYLNFVVFPNKNGTGQFGDTHFIAMDVTKEQREAGVKGPIIGSFTMPEEEQQPRQQSRPNTSGYRKPNTPPPTQADQGGGDWAEEEVPFAPPHYLTIGGW